MSKYQLKVQRQVYMYRSLMRLEQLESKALAAYESAARSAEACEVKPVVVEQELKPCPMRRVEELMAILICTNERNFS